MTNYFLFNSSAFLLVISCCAPFAYLPARAADVPNDVHRKCKGAQDYAGCVRANTTYLDGSAAPRDSNYSSQPSQNNLGSGASRDARSNGQKMSNGTPLGSSDSKSKVNLTNEKNITINSNNGNLIRVSPRVNQSSDPLRSKSAQQDPANANNPESSERSSKRTKRESNSSRSSDAPSQKRQSRLRQ